MTRDVYPDGAKATLFDGGTRVPMIVTGPGIEAGRVDDFVQTADIHATIAALVGVEVSSQDFFVGEEGERDFVYVEHFTNRETKGVSRWQQESQALSFQTIQRVVTYA